MFWTDHFMTTVNDDHLTLRATCWRQLFFKTWLMAFFKLTITVLIKYLTWTFVYLDVYVATDPSILFQSSVLRMVYIDVFVILFNIQPTQRVL